MKQVPLAEAARLREQRRKLQAEVARLEAEKQGWLVEKAYLILALEGHRTADLTSTKDG
jgi:Lon protease-like protein